MCQCEQNTALLGFRSLFFSSFQSVASCTLFVSGSIKSIHESATFHELDFSPNQYVPIWLHHHLAYSVQLVSASFFLRKHNIICYIPYNSISRIDPGFTVCLQMVHISCISNVFFILWLSQVIEIFTMDSISSWVLSHSVDVCH